MNLKKMSVALLFHLVFMGTLKAGLNFNGTSYMLCPTLNSNPTEITLSTWINVTTFPAVYADVFCRINGGNNNEQLFFVKGNGKLAAYVTTHTFTLPGINYDGTGNFTLSTGTWTHIAMTYDSINGLNGYVNGKLDGHVDSNAEIPPINQLFEIGDDTSTLQRTLNAQMDDIRYYERALTAQEIKNLASSRMKYNNTYKEYFYYPTNDVSFLDFKVFGSTAIDITGNQKIADRSGNNTTGVMIGTYSWTSNKPLNYP